MAETTRLVELEMACEKVRRELDGQSGFSDTIKELDQIKSLLDSRDRMTELNRKAEEMVASIEKVKTSIAEMDEMIKSGEVQLTIEENKLKSKERRIASLERDKRALEERNKQLISALRRKSKTG